MEIKLWDPSPYHKTEQKETMWENIYELDIQGKGLTPDINKFRMGGQVRSGEGVSTKNKNGRISQKGSRHDISGWKFPWGPHITVQDPHESFRAPGIENVHSFQTEIGNDLGWSCSPTKLEVRWQWMILLKSSSIVAENLEIAYPMRLKWV